VSRRKERAVQPSFSFLLFLSFLQQRAIMNLLCKEDRRRIFKRSQRIPASGTLAVTDTVFDQMVPSRCQTVSGALRATRLRHIGESRACRQTHGAALSPHNQHRVANDFIKSMRGTNNFFFHVLFLFFCFFFFFRLLPNSRGRFWQAPTFSQGLFGKICPPFSFSCPTLVHSSAENA